MALFTKIRERVTGSGSSVKFDSLEHISKNEDNKELAQSFDKENQRQNVANISVFAKEPMQKPLIRTSSFESSRKNDKFINILPNNENVPANRSSTPTNHSELSTSAAPKMPSYNVLTSRNTVPPPSERESTSSKDNRFATSRTVSFGPPDKESSKTQDTNSTKSQKSLDNNVFEVVSDDVDESFEEEDDYLEQVFSKTRHNHGPEVLEAIQKGFDVNSIDSNGNSMMHICAQNNHRKLAASILQRYPQCQINIVNFKGLTPLDYAHKYGFSKMAAWLSSVSAESGTQPSSNSGSGVTMLR